MADIINFEARRDERQNQMIKDWLDAWLDGMANAPIESIEDFKRLDQERREAITRINADRARAMFDLIESFGPEALGLMPQDEVAH